MAFHSENFVSVRRLYPLATERGRSRLEVASPSSVEERDYRDLLSEANLNYFHREYSIALQNYTRLRQKILEQSHPELPRMPGAGGLWSLDWSKVQLERIIELSRRVGGTVSPGNPVRSPLVDAPLIRKGEFASDPQFGRWATVGIDARPSAADPVLRDRARAMIKEAKFDEASRQYTAAADAALSAGQTELAADIDNEAAVMLATYASGPMRATVLRQSLESLARAEQLYGRAGNADAAHVARTNRTHVEAEVAGSTLPTTPTAPLPNRPGPLPSPLEPRAPVPGSPIPIPLPRGTAPRPLEAVVSYPVGATMARDVAVSAMTRVSQVEVRLPAEQTDRRLLLRDGGMWQTPAATLEQREATVVTATQYGMFRPDGATAVSLAQPEWGNQLRALVYQPRVSATTLDAIRFYEEVDVNFVAYYVHLYYFVLPVAIGDTYVAMGLYEKGIAEYRSVLSYPFLNLGIEGRYLWLKIAEATLQWGNSLYRREQRTAAAEKYGRILSPDGTVPSSAALYQGPAFSPLVTEVGEVVKRMRGQAHGPFNPRVGAVIVQAALRQRYLAQGFNFLGLAADHAPVLRFKYLQSVATYMADNAIEAERTFIGYRSNAETQKMERMQLESAVEVNKAALAIETKRMEDAQLEIDAARRTREYAELRRDNANAAVEEWDTKGRELTSMNAALSWAGAAANDQEIRYTGVRYDGERHDYEGTVEEFFDTVGEKREWLDWELQRNRLERQAAEVAMEVGLAEVREAQAQVRLEVQALNVEMQQLRVQAAEEVLEYAEQRMFDEDLWFQLAAQLQDLARDYLDAAIYAAKVMEYAYDLEFDRRLNRIRLDYGLGGPAGLLGGEMLKRDIISFTSDYLEHAQKKNPVRLALSLREEFPSGFATFVQTGLLPFRTDLELFDRRYPGTYRRKLKKIELFVEGLVPLEGASGFLTCHGVCSEWRAAGSSWAKHSRVMPVERMVLSSYQFRRDIAVFQPSEELLGLFENNAPQADWTLEIPRSGNNIDFNSIADVKLVVYFDADVSDALATHVKSFYPATGGRSTVISARFQLPDEYFRLDVDRRIRVEVLPSFFAFNHEAPTLSAFGVRLLDRSGNGMGGAALRVTRSSDASSVDVTTGPDGAASGDAATMAPFAAWKGVSPIDTWEISLGDGVDSTAIGDVQLFFSYGFQYRPDGSLV
jgi:hypothetical protein